MRFKRPTQVVSRLVSSPSLLWRCSSPWALGLLLASLAFSTADGQVTGIAPIQSVANSGTESSVAGTATQAIEELQGGLADTADGSFFEQQPQEGGEPSVGVSQAPRLSKDARAQRSAARQQSRAAFTDSSPMRLGVQIDALNYSKTSNDDTPFVFGPRDVDGITFPDFDSTLLSYSDLDSDTETAARIRFLYQSDWGTGYEFSFFNFDNFVGATTISGGVPTFFGAIPADLVESYDISDASRLKNFELNAWERRSQRWRFGWGVRYVDFRNEFNTIESGTGAASSAGTGFFSDADNDLFGAQILSDFYFPVGPSMQIETGVRAGGYYNNVDIRFESANRDVHYEGDNFSSVVDLNAGVRWSASNSLILRAGYQWMLVGGIASANSQSTDFDFFATSAPVQFSNTTFQGGYFGAEVRF